MAAKLADLATLSFLDIAELGAQLRACGLTDADGRPRVRAHARVPHPPGGTISPSIARNVLAHRLAKLVEAGVLEKRPGAISARAP